MKRSITQALREWRDQQARIEGVETFRVLPNAVLEALAGALPKTKEELLLVKGIKEAKYRKYGTAILSIVSGYHGMETGEIVPDVDEGYSGEGEGRDILAISDEPLSVSKFLDGLNTELSGMAARVKGEVTSVSERERWIYFSIKDAEGSTLNCLVSRYHYGISGVNLAEGDEIIVEGSPEIYKPMGRLSLKVSVIELCGEGALKKAYDALKKKLEEEGIFAPEKKRKLPLYPERIALITSRDGAAIDDFRMNLGAQGFRIDFYPTLVEGQRAVAEIIRAVRFFNRVPERYDILVIVRGGGSLESLQAFNNEALVREVSGSAIPTLLGVGHEKDVTLVALAADMMVSTPTATAKALRYHLDEARQLVSYFERQLPLLFRERLSDIRNTLSLESEIFLARFRGFREYVGTLRRDIAERLMTTVSVTRQRIADLSGAEQRMVRGFLSLYEDIQTSILHAEERFRQYDPKRVLKLGYGLVRQGERIIRDVSETAIGDILDIQLSRGALRTKVEKILE